MPIKCTVQPEVITQNRFREIDYITTGLAFSIHNGFGRLLDESIYHQALKCRCVKHGFNCSSEVQLEACHGTFTKSYYLDLILEQSAIYELKASQAITPKHESQLLNYLLLCGLRHGKIINFGSPSVESRFVSTSLTDEDRRSFTLRSDTWQICSDYCPIIIPTIQSILKDWGTHLDINLYREAILHLIGVKNTSEDQIDIFDGPQKIGKQAHPLLNQQTAIHISSIHNALNSYDAQLNRLLKNSKLSAIQWINFQGNNIQCTTLLK